MYGKIDENGKFIAAQKKVTHEGNKTIIEDPTQEECAKQGMKEVFTGAGTGRPGPDMMPQYTYEDKGDFILKRMNWVKKPTKKNK